MTRRKWPTAHVPRYLSIALVVVVLSVSAILGTAARINAASGAPQQISWGLTGGNGFSFSVSLHGDGAVIGKAPPKHNRVVWHFGTMNQQSLSGLIKLANAEGFATWPQILVHRPNPDIPYAFVRVGSRTVYAYEGKDRPAEANFNELLAVLRAASHLRYCNTTIPCALEPGK